MEKYLTKKTQPSAKKTTSGSNTLDAILGKMNISSGVQGSSRSQTRGESSAKWIIISDSDEPKSSVQDLPLDLISKTTSVPKVIDSASCKPTISSVHSSSLTPVRKTTSFPRILKFATGRPIISTGVLDLSPSSRKEERFSNVKKFNFNSDEARKSSVPDVPTGTARKSTSSSKNLQLASNTPTTSSGVRDSSPSLEREDTSSVVKTFSLNPNEAGKSSARDTQYHAARKMPSISSNFNSAQGTSTDSSDQDLSSPPARNTISDLRMLDSALSGRKISTVRDVPPREERRVTWAPGVLDSPSGSATILSDNSRTESSTRLPQNLTIEEELDRCNKLRDVGLYIICDSDKCGKLRFQPNCHDPTEVPEKWQCSKERGLTCRSAELPIAENIQKDLIENLYNAGSLVWAKCDDYPWWPAIVCDDPQTMTYYKLHKDTCIPKEYHVIYFEEEGQKKFQFDWLTPKNLKPFNPDKTPSEILSKATSDSNELNLRRKQAYELCLRIHKKKMSIYERLDKYGYMAVLRSNKNSDNQEKNISSEKQTKSGKKNNTKN